MDTPTSFVPVNFFDGALEYGSGLKFSSYVGSNAEPLCVEFCNFMQCHTFVNNLSYYYWI
jgi:hypothetical protein